MTEAPSLRDPYVVLGLEKSATENEIKSAYKKCALKYHPDKNHGEGAEDAADKFKEAVTAYNILIDPDKRRRYDAGGFDNLEASELEVELDLSSMGPMNTFMAAMFAKLGVSAKVLKILWNCYLCSLWRLAGVLHRMKSRAAPNRVLCGVRCSNQDCCLPGGARQGLGRIVPKLAARV